MRKLLVIGCCAALWGCTEQSVYDRELPAPDDSAAMIEIRDGLRPEDARTWQQIVMRRLNPAAQPIHSKTVGEAIAKVKAQRACMDENFAAMQAAGIDNGEAYSRHANAYNDCLEMPL